MFFDDVELVSRKAATVRRPPIPETGWATPTEYPDLSHAKVISFDTETRELDFDHGPGWARGKGHIVGVAVSAIFDDSRQYSAYYPVRHEVESDRNCDPGVVFRWLKTGMATPRIPKVGANLLYDIGWLAEEGVVVQGDLYDVQFAEALLDETAPTALEALGQKYVGEGKDSHALYEWLADAHGGSANGRQRANIYRAPPQLAGLYAESDAVLPLQIIERQWPLLEAEGLLDLFRMECASIPMLVKMRQNGVRVDVAEAERLYDELGVTILRLYDELAHISGVRIESVSAAAQVARCFDAVGLRYPETAEGAPSFRKEWLSAQTHPVAAKINEIREHEKIRNTFIKSYVLDSHHNGRLHCQFHPLRSEDGGTITGRYSCVAPFTPILTPSGPRPINTLHVGDFVWTHKERWRRVLARYVKGREEMLAVTFSNGNILTCTRAHRLLLSAGRWVTVGEIADVYFKAMGDEREKYSTEHSALSRPQTVDSGANCWRAWNNLSQYIARFAQTLAGSRAESTRRDALFGGEDSRAESDVWEVRRSASQLDWTLRRWPRLFDRVARWKEAVRASCSYGARYWSEKIAGYLRSSPYRHESEKQRSEQLGLSNSCRAQDYSLFAGEGQQGLRIEKIEAMGSYEVHDITVEDDESYASCGVFSHNSSNPNLQNIPTRSSLGKRVRKLFVPDDGHIGWEKNDHSQIEYRMLAHFATGPGSDELRETYQREPRTDYHDRVFQRFCAQTGLDYAHMSKEEKAARRRPLKNINFGLIYGQSERSLAYKGGMTDQDAKEFFASYHESAPYVKPTMRGIAASVQREGFIQTVLGRRVRFNLWEPKEHGAFRPLPYDRAVAAYGYALKRAGDYKGTNYKFQGSAADVMKAGMLKAYREGVFDVTGLPKLQVHDELDFSVIDDTPQQNEAYRHLRHCLETAVPALRVPLYVDSDRGANWGECG